MEPEPVGRHCPKCKTREKDMRVKVCTGCGETLLELFRTESCPKCGVTARDLNYCSSCGTELIIGLPLTETYPEKPFEAPMKPVILLRSGAPGPLESGLPPAGMGGEEAAQTSAKLAGLYFTTNPDQMSGTSKDHLRLSVGESTRVYIRGQDPEGKWFQIPLGLEIKWEADKELELQSDQWDVVSVKLVGVPKVTAMATATATNPAGQKIDKKLTVQRR